MTSAIKTVDLEDAKFYVFQDDCAYNPRTEFDNLGTMVCWHRRYNMGDKHSFSSPSDFSEEITEKNAIILPIFMHEHSDISLSTKSFNDRWDSGQLGFIYVLKSTAKKEYNVKRISPKVRAKVEACLRSEVETYNQYVSGDVYGCRLEDTEGEAIDSCWGFFGTESLKGYVQDAIPKKYQEKILEAL